MDSIPTAEPVKDDVPTAIVLPKKWEAMDWREKLERFLKNTEITLDGFEKNMTNFYFENEYTAVYPMEYFSTIKGSFELTYTYNSIDVELSGFYTSVQTYDNRYEPDEEKEISGTATYPGTRANAAYDNVWISWDEFSLEDKIHIDNPFWLIGKLHQKFTDEWEDLMSVKMDE